MENLKKVILASIALVNDMGDAVADGKVSLSEKLTLIKDAALFPYVNFKGAIAELKALDEADRAVLMDQIAAELHLQSGEAADTVAQEAFSIMVSLGRIRAAVKK